ncbi:MAG: GtrA family protein [Alphaproteobacteria bacterium]|nr:GtrA family protein [Alphaproteobacteria bacterium]
MSAALQSLMPRFVEAPPARSAFGGIASFLAIGASGALGFLALTNVMMALPTGLDNWVVNSLCYGAFIVPIYLLHRRFSFQSDAPHRQALPRYLAVQASALLLATLFGYLLYHSLTMSTPLASSLVIVLTSGVNYLVLRGWAFARGQIGALVPA